MIKAQEYFLSRMQNFDDLYFAQQKEKPVEVLGYNLETKEEFTEFVQDLFLEFVALPENQFKLLMSWGGPSDWFIVKMDNHGFIKEITYYWQDWFIQPVKIKLNSKQFATVKAVLEKNLNFNY